VTYVLFFVLLLYIPAMIGSAFDRSLTDPESSATLVAFFEEFLLLGGVAVSGIMCYLYRRVFDYVPRAMA